MALLILALCAAATAQTTQPASAPAVEMLDEGRVRLVAPAGWELEKRGDDGLSLRYTLGDVGVIAVTVNPQHAGLTREDQAKMAKVIGQSLREAARNEGAQFLIHPRVEPDERFFLKVRDRTRGGDGKVRDQLQMYKAMNLELVHVAAVAMVETEAESQPIFAAAEEMLDNAALGGGLKPSAFRKTRVRLTVPSNWVESRTDDPNGVVATYTNPAVPGARLVVRSKIIPRAAKANPDVLAKTIDLLMDAHRTEALPDGATVSGDVPREPHPRFVRRVSRSLSWSDQPWGTDFRSRIVGDVVIGVEALSPPGDQEVSRLADEMALSIKPLADRPPVADSQRPQAPQTPRRREDNPRMGLPQPGGQGIRGNPGGR